MDRRTAPAFRFALVTLAAIAALAAVGWLGAFGLSGGCTVDAAPLRLSSQPVAGRAATASFRFPSEPEARPEASRVAPKDAPIGLTASDGTGLALVALDAHGVLDPPLAFTELHLTFENPRDQTIEGRFRIALPPGAALSRFAMKIGDRWQEGEVVERQRARVAYEDFLHRRQDPALLEHEAGNEFSARVFPIPARGRKEIVVSYSHTLTAADEPYLLPLRGLAEVGRLDVEVLLGERPVERAGESAGNLGAQVHDRRVVALHRRDWTPDRDFRIGQELFPGRAGLRHENLAVVRVEAPVEPVPQEIAGLYVLIDSSASRAYDYAAQVELVGRLIDGLRNGAGKETPVAVAAFDQEVVPVYEGTAGGFGAIELAHLRERRPLGASDLGAALGWLGDRLAGAPARYPRVLLATDGIATAGEVEARALKAAVAALGKRGVERVDVLALGGLRDQAALRELVTGNLGSDGQVIDGDAPLAEIGRRLTRACRSGIAVAVEGAEWVWPETLDGVQPGDQALVYADLPAERPLRLSLAGRASAIGEGGLGDGLARAERPLLERAWVQARIERLLHLRDSALGGDADLRRALALQVTELSVRHRVVSPFTAFLVLETEADYRRFGLDRRALADILTVGVSGLDVLARSAPPPALDGGPTGAAAKNAVEIAAGDAPEGIVRGRDDVASGTAGGQVPDEQTAGMEERALGEAVTVSGEGLASAEMAPPPPPPSIAEPAPAAPEDVEAPAQIAEEILVTGEPRRREVPRPRRRRSADTEQVVVAGIEYEPDDLAEPDLDPYAGRFAEVMARLAAGETATARRTAEAWQTESPGDVLALVALGEALEAEGDPAGAARAYGSLIDLFPSRADLRRTAGERLERLGAAGLALAIDTYAKAVEQRPDHPSGHRLLAWALLRAGRAAEAFAALEKGLEQNYPSGRFAGVDQVLREDLGLLAAAWLRAEPDRREAVLARLESHGARLDSEPSLRFVLTWETDANDVDLHVFDRKGGHAFYSAPTLASGGHLYADVTTGYGPECFTVPEPAKRRAGPYRLKAHYYRRGPMGYGMGTVQVVNHDGDGGITLDPRPFVVMADGATVDLGTTDRGPRGKAAK